MPKPRGHEHTTLTETADLVVQVVEKIAGVKMIAPGEIKTTSRNKNGHRFVTIVYTPAGCELIITGQSVQKVAVHIENPTIIINELKKAKSLREFVFKERERLPGV
ncbi:hypothetical protein H6784_04515 [Candidatus Nomurabacteria bacterium]|nr:hypothetical protein [Candidatus Kaiserbacteria bacterium]MCB9814651.1 hypothetical protein [Candidatus Nomurabacteria bacterium]